ncbi:ABCA1 [Symbiodinium microadriaticum]|nr:ABCA1 [Symbiodinium microadriaticum]
MPEAGKTSTLNMLTGAVLPSAGSAFLGGFDVVQEQRKVRRLLGFCPQHDALLDRLTVREHLELFGRIKGIPNHAIKELCDQMMQDLSLSPHVDKLAMTLSGGNKRKLSLAIALMASPPLVFLDEPSTGVDPAARRLMWHVISAVSTMRRESTVGIRAEPMGKEFRSPREAETTRLPKRTRLSRLRFADSLTETPKLSGTRVILTTHNMEEAEALCSRVGIMVGGRLRCFGSNQRLKARFGQGYQLEMGSLKLETGRLPDRLDATAVAEQCTAAGKPGCEEGYVEPTLDGGGVYDSLSREGSISALHFAEWWLFEDSALKLNEYLAQHFPGTVALERRELSLEDYGVSQCLASNRAALWTSLEQIFNDFAAMQQEERGPVQGRNTEALTAKAPDARTGSVEMIASAV